MAYNRIVPIPAALGLGWVLGRIRHSRNGTDKTSEFPGPSLGTVQPARGPMVVCALAKAVLFPQVCTSLKTSVTSGTNDRWKHGTVQLLKSHERDSIWYHIGLWHHPQRAGLDFGARHLCAPLARRPKERAFPPEERGGPTWSPGGAAAPAIALGGLRALSLGAPRPRRGQCGAHWAGQGPLQLWPLGFRRWWRPA